MTINPGDTFSISVFSVFNRAADKIVSGEIKVALMVGAEALYRDVHFRHIFNLPALRKRYEQDPSVLGEIHMGEMAHEILHGADRAPHIYPLFENALRAHLRMTMQEHREFLRVYYDNLADVSADNPYAWFNKDRQQDDVIEPTVKNPIFNFPYTKHMNPVLPVNQAAAVIMTDTDTAHRLAIPRDKWVYLHGGADAADKWFISQRVNYYSSPGIRFIVESAMEIGLPLGNLPPLTITGGLNCSGGPGNNYVMHSIAHAVKRLRKNPHEFGLVTGVGNYLTKHSAGIYSGVEPEKAWSREPKENIQARIDALESPILNEQPNGPATVETYTVLHDTPDGVPWPIIIARLDSGERCFATTVKGSELALRMEQDEFIGYRGYVSPGGNGPNIFT